MVYVIAYLLESNDDNDDEESLSDRTQSTPVSPTHLFHGKDSAIHPPRSKGIPGEFV
jgi:hypothetical protein